jgi:hypothetical protein
MSIATYGGLKAAIADWLDRGDLTAQIPDFVRLAEATINKVFRSPRMVGNATVATAANTRYVALPADFLEMLFVTLTDEDYPLEQVSPQELAQLRRFRLKAAGSPRYFAIVGGRVELCPTPSAIFTLDIAYYQAVPALVSDGGTNWLLSYEPDVYLYTSLLHASQFLSDAGAAALRESLLVKQIAAATAANQTISLDAKGAA